ncbi:hypothetical protein SO694_00005341 [Aureococcus anophagefferens]|uniref:Uncharacterized protein n=1 Tax=Aureococcus anophagefferens TaxID=44056 RepID=A0ABR1GA79_AURAN
MDETWRCDPQDLLYNPDGDWLVGCRDCARAGMVCEDGTDGGDRCADYLGVCVASYASDDEADALDDADWAAIAARPRTRGSRTRATRRRQAVEPPDDLGRVLRRRKNAEDRCSLKDDYKVKSKGACPLSCGECEVGASADSTRRGTTRRARTTATVAKKPEDRCSLKDDAKVKSKDACPLSCGEREEDVPAPAPTATPEEEDEDEGCADSTSWYWKKSNTIATTSRRSRRIAAALKDDYKVKRRARPHAGPRADGGAEDEDEDEGEGASCADSTPWYWKKSKYDCDYVAKKPEDRCSLKDDYKVKSKDA